MSFSLLTSTSVTAEIEAAQRFLHSPRTKRAEWDSAFVLVSYCFQGMVPTCFILKKSQRTVANDFFLWLHIQLSYFAIVLQAHIYLRN